MNSFYLKRLTLIFLNVSLVTSVVSLGWFRASTKLAYSVWKLGSMLALFITRYWAAHGKYSSVTSFFNSSVCYQIIISSIVTCYSLLSHIRYWEIYFRINLKYQFTEIFLKNYQYTILWFINIREYQFSWIQWKYQFKG